MYILRSQINNDADDPSYNTYYENWVNVAVSDRQSKLENVRDIRLVSITIRNSHIRALQSLYDRLMQVDPIAYIPQPSKEHMLTDRKKYVEALRDVLPKNLNIKQEWHTEKWAPCVEKYCQENNSIFLLADSDILNGKILPEPLPTFVIEEIDSV